MASKLLLLFRNCAAAFRLSHRLFLKNQIVNKNRTEFYRLVFAKRFFPAAKSDTVKSSSLFWKFILRGSIPSSALLAFVSVAYCARKPSSNFGGTVVDRRSEELIYAALANDADKIKRLIKAGADPNDRHSLGWTALHVAAFHGHVDAVLALIQNGADVNAVDEFAGVHAMVEKGRLNANFIDVIFARQEHFSSRLHNSENYRGTTALHYAVLAHRPEVVRILIANGADPTLENELGHLPLDYAFDDETRLMLQEYGEKFEKEKKKRDLEERRRFPLEERLKQAIIGQESAIATVAAAIRRREMGWSDDEHPLVFLFLGSSGIGKTELAKQAALYLNRDVKQGFIRIDMSEYQQKHEVSKFIGSPPGYIGHDEGGQLTKKLKENPRAVVLFDEIEKAHPDILTIMLQLFDEGRLTDGQGNTVQCKDAIFIMTSNLASDEIGDYGVKLREEAARANKMKVDASIEDFDKKVTVSRNFKENVVRPILKRHFKRDEFLGRITEMVYFLPFSRSELIQLVAKEMEYWARKAAEKHSIQLTWDRNVLEVLADGYNVHYGARSIKHEVARRVANKLAIAHENALISEGCSVKLYTNLPPNPIDRSNANIEFEVTSSADSTNKRVLNIPLTDAFLESMSTF